jgi:hypothetical protein
VNRIYERLADKSAFVIFDNDSFQTYVVQTTFILERLYSNKPAVSEEKFESLSLNEQIDLFIASGIDKELN